MRKLLSRWLITSVLLTFGVSVLTFVLASLVPGDAARSILGLDANPQQYKQLRQQLHLNEPLWTQYGHWLTNALHGNLGQSISTSAPVSQELTGRLAVTLSLVIGAVIVAVVAGIGLGTIAALRGGVVGRSIDALSLLGMAIPAYWLGLVFITLLAVKVQIFPATGYTPLGSSPLRWFESLVLPVLTLGFGSAAPIAKQTRDGILNELGQGYVLALRARGVSERRIVLMHVLRNAGTPVLSVIGLVTVGLFGGTVLVETVFVLPGLGSLVVTAASAHDIPVVQGVAVVFTLLVVAVNLFVEIGYAALNPKVRT